MHLYAALAEKERRLISERTTGAGGKAGQRCKARQSVDDRSWSVRPADITEFAARLMPVIDAVRRTGATTLEAICGLWFNMTGNRFRVDIHKNRPFTRNV